MDKCLYAAEACTLHLPAHIGDYTDFYGGIHHATNVGKQFRPDNPLLPNYKHVSIGRGRSRLVFRSWWSKSTDPLAHPATDVR